MAKVAIVTGASRGIGRSIAQRLAADGFAVVVNYAGNTAAAEETVQAIRKADGEAIAVKGDVGNPADVKALFDKTIETYNRVDVVVNNAGIMILKPIAAGDVEIFDKVIAANLRGTFLVFAEAAKHVEKGGRIIGLSSSVLGLNYPTYGPYIASKAGVEGLVRVLANEVRGRNITVNAVSPGPVATELFFEGKSQELLDRLVKLPPLERFGQPDDIAGVISFLAGPDGGWINGQILRANGGLA